MRLLIACILVDTIVVALHIFQPTYSLDISPGRISHNAGNAYVVRVFPRFPSPIVGTSDNLSDPFRSSLRLFEEGAPIGPPHSLHSHIRATGKGSYSFWDGDL